MRIFAAGISQESNSFNPLKSTMDDFYAYKGQEFREMAGVRALLDAGCEVVESVWFRAVPGGTLKFADFMQMAEQMLRPLEEDTQGFDGVFLPMHGALDVEHIGSGETFIAARIREIVGPDVPIAAPLDMHANVTYSLIENCNIVYGYRTAPHIDVAETHVRTAKMLVKAISQGVLPKTRVLRIPCIMPGENMMTSSGIGKQVIARLPLIEEAANIWCASYFVGMAWVDAYRNGAAIVVTGVGDMADGMDKAQDLAQFVWDKRREFEYQGLAMEPAAAVQFAKAHAGKGLVILSDSADNVTAGAAGDNALMLNLFLENDIQNALFAAIIDPIAVEKASKHSVGDTIDIHIGGCFDKSAEKVTLAGAVVKHMNLPESCVVSYRGHLGHLGHLGPLGHLGIDVLLFSKRKPVFDAETLAAHGLSLGDYEILVVKQGYLSPELLAASQHSVMALTSGNCNQNLAGLRYKKLRRPVFPLDDGLDIFDWRARVE